VNLAHGAAVDVLRAHVPQASIGAVHCRQPWIAATAEDQPAVELIEAYWNNAFADPQYIGLYPPVLAPGIEPYLQAGDLARINRPVDWFGLNHYSPSYIKADSASLFGFASADPPPDLPCSCLGWPIVPEGFRDTLLETHRRYGLPIYVMENGMAAIESPDETGEIADQNRIDYLARYTEAMRGAITAGADVRGYFVWSLLDNFEWTMGYGPRFGIVYVDYPTRRRTPKASFRWYADMISGQRNAEVSKS
jgi:beta-glucosidase